LKNSNDEFFELTGFELDRALKEFDVEFELESRKANKNVVRNKKRYGIRQDDTEDSRPNSRRRRYSIKDSGEGDTT
jgi:hypothetical protein